MKPVEAIEKHGLKPTGVIQVGSHWGEEQPLWDQLGLIARHFEPVSSNLLRLRAACLNNPKARVYPYALGNVNRLQMINVETSNGGQSCSLLAPKMHLQEFPDIKFIAQEEVRVIRLDDLEKVEPPGQLRGCNFLYMDAQGYELEILKGAAGTLDQIDAIITEVNRAEMFDGCPMVDEIDWHLSFAGYKRVETNWHNHLFGDALYIR